MCQMMLNTVKRGEEWVAFLNHMLHVVLPSHRRVEHGTHHANVAILIRRVRSYK